MSQQDLEEGIQPDDRPGQPQSQSLQKRSSRQQKREANFGDSSGPLFSMYSKIAEEEDNKLADRCQKDADGLLIFTGLFSATVAALLTFSVQDLRPDPQDASAFYLEKIYLIVANTNLSQASIPSPVAKPPPFSPPRYAVSVNSLWFLSLVISLTCALLATSQQQWARRYVRVTQPAHCSPEKRARIRAFFARGVDNMRLPRVVEVLPALLHLSVFLFLSGLVIFLLNVNHNVYLCVIWWIGLFSALYACITLMPMFFQESPYYTPLSSSTTIIALPILVFIIGTVNIVCLCVSWIAVILCAPFYFCFSCVWNFTRSCTGLSGRHRVRDGSDGDASPNDSRQTSLIHRDRLTWRGVMWFPRRVDNFFVPTWRAVSLGSYGLSNIGEAAEEAISNRYLEIDLDIFHWTIGALGDDDLLEKFFHAIPGFLTSKLVNANINDMITTFPVRLQDTLDGFIRRTLSSDSVIESVKNRRLDIYLNAELSIYGPSQVFKALVGVLRGKFGQLPQSVRTAYTLAHWCTSDIKDAATVARYLVASILQTVQKRDGRWLSLAKDPLGLPEPVLRNSIALGDSSASLAIHLHMTRQILHTDPRDCHWQYLSALSRFDIRNTLPGLQNEFCALWNEIVPKARNMDEPYHGIANAISHFYLDLHPDTAVTPRFDGFISITNPQLPSPTPLCNVAAHHPNSPTHDTATASPAVPPPTRVDDQSGAQPHAVHLESQPTTSCNTAPQANETDNVTTLPSPAVPTSPHAQGSPSLFPTIELAHSAPQVTSVPNSSTHECLDIVSSDLTVLDSEASHHTYQSSLSTAHLTESIVHPDEPIPALPIEEAGETSVPIFVQQPDCNTQQEIVHASSVITQTSSTANQIPQSICDMDVTVQSNEESSIVPPATLSSSPVMMPAVHNDSTLFELPSSTETSLIQPDHMPHAQGSLPSSLPTGRSQTTPRVTFAMDAQTTTSGIPSTRNTHALACFTPSEISHHSDQPIPTIPDTAQKNVPPEDCQLGRNEV